VVVAWHSTQYTFVLNDIVVLRQTQLILGRLIDWFIEQCLTSPPMWQQWASKGWQPVWYDIICNRTWQQRAQQIPGSEWFSVASPWHRRVTSPTPTQRTLVGPRSLPPAAPETTPKTVNSPWTQSGASPRCPTPRLSRVCQGPGRRPPAGQLDLATPPTYRQ